MLTAGAEGGLWHVLGLVWIGNRRLCPVPALTSRSSWRAKMRSCFPQKPLAVILYTSRVVYRSDMVTPARLEKAGPTITTTAWLPVIPDGTIALTW
jgi:hypothetical protein